jgi:hypothetical protein
MFRRPGCLRRFLAPLFAAAVLLGAGPLAAQDDGLEGLTPGSPADAIYGADHLSGLPDKAVLVFDYRFDGTLLDKPFADDVLLDFTRHTEDRGFDVEATLFPGSQNLSIGPLSAAKVNPILLIFFQRDATQMSNGTGGSQHYFRNALRRVLQTPDPDGRHAVTIEFEGRQVDAREVRFQPFVDDPNRARLRAYADKTYSFVLSEAVPGGIYEVRTETPEEGGGGILLRESYRFREMRQ